jgi:hypothetical protein
MNVDREEVIWLKNTNINKGIIAFPQCLSLLLVCITQPMAISSQRLLKSRLPESVLLKRSSDLDDCLLGCGGSESGS